LAENQEEHKNLQGRESGRSQNLQGVFGFASQNKQRLSCKSNEEEDCQNERKFYRVEKFATSFKKQITEKFRT